MKLKFCFLVFCGLTLSACVSRTQFCPDVIIAPQLIDSRALMEDLKVLSSDQMQGRKTGSQGNIKARQYIKQKYSELDLQQFTDAMGNVTFNSPFIFGSINKYKGVNIIGWKKGSVFPDEYIVITAHYDHLGKSGSNIYNGADDNASGVAAMLALARYLVDKQTQHSIIFLATDAEEIGLFGGKAFIQQPPVPLEKIKFNLNLDMVAQGGKKQTLFVSGTRSHPQFKQLVQQASQQGNVCLIAGHDGRKRYNHSMLTTINWKNASDHAAFARADIPYLYIGVDPHNHYHQPTDTFKSIDPVFFSAAGESILKTFLLLDQLSTTETE